MWYFITSWTLLSENLQPPLKNPTPPFLITLLLSAHPPFCQHWKLFSLPPSPPRLLSCRMCEETLCPVSVKIRVFQFFFKWHLYNYKDYVWSKSAQSFSAQSDVVYWGYCPKYPPKMGPIGSWTKKSSCFFQVKSRTKIPRRWNLASRKYRWVVLL